MARYAIFLLLGFTLPVAYAATPDLHLCAAEQAYCGTLTRPLDPAGEVPGTIDIAFELYPARDRTQPVLGTIVAVEGGPGFATTGSSGGYLALFYPLLDRRNLLLVDNRGTGGSGAIRCEPLQSEPIQTVHDAGVCGAELGASSDLFGTALATDDLAAVIEALGTGPVDLYGDSYGTWFSQAFAVNHPDLVRAVILDSAYPVQGENPFYPFAGYFNRRNYDEVCEKSLSCQNLPGTSQQRIAAAVAALRQNPIEGQAYDGNGNLRNVTGNPTAVAYTEYAGTMGEVIYRDLDAAVRAYAWGDTAPLLRLFAENDLTSAYQQPGGPVSEYSRGLFAAVSCSDYPQIYNMTGPLSVRAQQDEASIAHAQASDPGLYAPFTIDEFRQMSIDVSVLDLCVGWPVPSAAHPPQHSISPGAAFPAVPVLVLSGGLDALTTPIEGALTTQLFPNARQVLIANSFHVTAVDDLDDCASRIALHFFTDLTTGDTSCAATISEVRTVPNFATVLADVQGAEPLPGNQGNPSDLQLAANATLAAGDAIARWWVNTSESGVGLRGGTFTYTQNLGHVHYTLNEVQWTRDVTVSGSIYWNLEDGGSVTAELTAAGPDNALGTFTATWTDRQPHAMATITGQAGGRSVHARMYAP
jgi:pimeloyl-ACP methyl ester carboxylesterase